MYLFRSASSQFNEDNQDGTQNNKIQRQQEDSAFFIHRLCPWFKNITKQQNQTNVYQEREKGNQVERTNKTSESSKSSSSPNSSVESSKTQSQQQPINNNNNNNNKSYDDTAYEEFQFTTRGFIDQSYNQIYNQYVTPDIQEFIINIDSDLKPKLSLQRPKTSTPQGQIFEYQIQTKRVAILLLHFNYQPQQSQSVEKEFIKDLYFLCRLSSKYLVKFEAISVIPGQRAIAIEYMDYSLRTFIHKVKRTKPISTKSILTITKCVANALKYLHSKGIVHRDINPRNVLIDKKGIVKVTNYGLYSVLNKFDVSRRSNSASLGYIAPEIFYNGTVSPKSDIWALGIIIWELVSMRPPWEGMTPASIATQICKNLRPEIPKNTPQGIQKMIEICWHQDSEKRPSADDVVKNCQTLLANL